MATTRMDILQMIDAGEISAEEGMRMLAELEESEVETAAPVAPMKSPEMEMLERIERGELSTADALHEMHYTEAEEGSEEPAFEEPAPERASTPKASQAREASFNKWREWWLIPFAIGAVIIVLSGNWMSDSYSDAGVGFWFLCAWVPMLLGVALAGLAFASRNSPWVHVRVNSKESVVRVSLPLPMGITSWGLANFGHHIPSLDTTQVDELLIALNKTVTGDTPLHIVVDDDGDGEHVEVFIG